MRPYILDADIISYFQRAGLLDLLAGQAVALPWTLVDEVEDELVRARGYGEAALRALRRHAVPVIRIDDGSHEATLLDRLHKGPGHPDRGEAASIAAAAYQTELIFVTNDRNASMLALSELYSAAGERCIRTPTFLRRLHERDLLSSSDIDHLVKCNEKLVWPSWWETWLAGG